jgi:polar amino acid transport system substrate-binding protein
MLLCLYKGIEEAFNETLINELNFKLKALDIRTPVVMTKVFAIKSFISLSFLISFPVYSQKFVAVTGDWRPYIYEEANSIRFDRPGYSAAIVIEAFNRMNHKLDIKTYSFARQIALVESGEADLLIGLYESDAPQLRYPQEAIALSENCFFQRPESQWRYLGSESLDNIRLGIIKGYTYGQVDIDAYLLSPDRGEVVEIAGSETQMIPRLFQLLTSQRIDAFPQDKAIIANYIRSLQDQLEIPQYKIGTCFSKVFAYVAFSPKINQVTQLMEDFDKTLRHMRKEGRIGKILKEYGAQDWAPISTD